MVARRRNRSVVLLDNFNAQQPHTTPSARSPLRGLSQLKTGWNDLTGNYRNNIPPALGNVSGFQAIQFRVSVNFADVRNLADLAQDFRVVLTDASGASSSVRVSDVSVERCTFRRAKLGQCRRLC